MIIGDWFVRICLISREYPPETHIGGIASYTYKTAVALARLGHEVHVVTAARMPATEYDENGVRVHRMEELLVKPREWRAIAHAQLVARTISELPGRFDVIQACEWGGEAAWYALKPKRRAPLVTRLATPLFLVDQLNQNLRHVTRRLVFRYMEYSQTHRSDGIISPTHALANIVCQRWRIDPGRVTVVRTGIDPLSVSAKNDCPLPAMLSGENYLLYFGRLEERKGVHILGMALPAVLEAHPALKAVFVGDELGYRGVGMREAIISMNQQYADRIIFLPRLPQRELFPIIRAAHLVVLPSLWENLANTCLEAMQLGRPVVATRHCGFEEVIEDNVSGFLVEPGDAKALALRILEVLDDRSLLDRVGAGALRRMANFAIDPMAMQLADYYARLVQRWRDGEASDGTGIARTMG